MNHFQMCVVYKSLKISSGEPLGLCSKGLKVYRRSNCNLAAERLQDLQW